MKLKRVVCVVRHGARTPLVDGSSPVLGLTEWKPEVRIEQTFRVWGHNWGSCGEISRGQEIQSL